MGTQRVAINLDETSAWFNRLSFIADGIPRECVFNMDEPGCSDHTDGREVRVIGPIDCPDPSVPVPYARHSKRSTFVACIAADGFRIKLFAIVRRFRAEKELRYYGYDESNVVLRSQSNAFMTRELFELWAKTIVFPIIDQRHRDLGYQGKELLLMDALRFHHTEQFLVECAARNIEALFLIAHASDQENWDVGRKLLRGPNPVIMKRPDIAQAPKLEDLLF